MPAGFTNKGKAILLSSMFQGESIPTQFTVHLILDNSVSPGPLTDLLSELTELSRTEYEPALIPIDESSFLLTEGDTGETSYITMSDIYFTAGVNRIPLDEARSILHAVLCDQDENVIAYWSGDAGFIPPGRSLILQSLTLRLTDNPDPGT